MSSNHPPPTIEYVLLGLLHQEPSHGYDLYKKIKGNETLSQIWRLKQSKLYYLLEKLEDQVLIEATRVSAENRPARKVYHLTEKGVKTFLAWIESPVKRARHVRIVFLARLYFAFHVNREHALNLIARQRAQCQAWKESLENQLQDAASSDFIITQAFTFRIGQIQAILDWLNECEKHIIT